MNIINEKGTDFSVDILVLLGIMLECVWGAEIVAYKVSRMLEQNQDRPECLGFNITNSLFKRKKESIREARTFIQMALARLEKAFDKTFDRVMEREGEEGLRAGYMQKTANDIVQLLIIYYSRADGDIGKRDRMKKALMNFKPDDNMVDLEGLLKYFDFKI